MDRLADFRRVFASVVAARAGVTDPGIERAFAKVPRHEFVDPGPWRLSENGPPTSSADPALLYLDVALGLAPERGITTGLPSLHARCIAACGVEPGFRVVQIGAGAGYFTAILAELVGPDGNVVAFELDEALAAKARVNLRPWRNVEVRAQSGTDALGTMADVIYVCAGIQQLPRAWLESMGRGARLAFPLTPGTEEGGMLLVQRTDSQSVFSAAFICRARFIPCEGTSDVEASQRLAAAFREDGHDAVRSLRTDPEKPDSSAWFIGNGWWLSTRALCANVT